MISILLFIMGFIIGTATKRRWTHTRAHQRNLGEAMVANTLDNSKGLHVLLNNVTLQTEDGTTQIDHIFITEAGIFVVESKHYTGWIFGDPKDEYWTQTNYRMKNRFSKSGRCRGTVRV